MNPDRRSRPAAITLSLHRNDRYPQPELPVHKWRQELHLTQQVFFCQVHSNTLFLSVAANYPNSRSDALQYLQENPGCRNVKALAQPSRELYFQSVYQGDWERDEPCRSASIHVQ